MPLFQNKSKRETFQMKMSSACSFIFMHMNSHLDSLETEAQGKLGNDLSINTLYYSSDRSSSFVSMSSKSQVTPQG